MARMLTDSHLFALLGACFAASVAMFVARVRVMAFVQTHDIEVSARFEFAPRPAFFSWKSRPEVDPGEDQLFRWLKNGGANEVVARHPKFELIWKWYGRLQVAAIVLISVWLPAAIWTCCPWSPPLFNIDAVNNTGRR